MPENREKKLHIGLFAAFVFLQFTVLWLGNHAGEGYLSTERREHVYYAIQVFVILGFLAYAAADGLIRGERLRRRIAAAVLALFAVGAGVMLLAHRASAFYVTVTFAVMPCLGYLGGAVYHRMSRETAAGAKTARSMGAGCAAAVVLQYFLQIRWGLTPVLAVFVLAALGLLAYTLLWRPPELPPETREGPKEGASHRLLFACLIAAGLLAFVGFYNESIHHLQIRSGYTAYNVYSWPRLMMLPGYLLFAVIGDRDQGRLVPVAALCVTLAALLNAALTGAYWLNMCLFYVALSGAVSFYNLTFWRLAPETGHPALWASVGRMLDSGMVLAMGLLRTSLLSPAAVQVLSVAGLAGVILLLTASGGFNPSPPPVPAAVSVPAPLLPDDALDRMREQYALTPRETEVLRELVLTEDKQAVIGARMDVNVKTIQKYVTQIYRKTGAATRSGLTDLYRDAADGR